MKIFRFEILLVAVGATVVASPALAHFFHCPGTPAPVAGLGYGAIAAVGVGYRALKRRIAR